MESIGSILIITQIQGYLITNIKERLETYGYDVLVMGADVDLISRIETAVDGILIYSEDKILDEHKAMVYLRDKIIEETIPVFIIGNAEELDEISGMIPDHAVQKKFERPIDVNIVSNEMDEYIKHKGKKTKKKILVVDDSGAMLRNVKGWLEDKYQVILANSGTRAIKYLAMETPDLILLDYEMPVIDGKQVLEMIRSEEEFRDVPVIFLTSKGDRESVMKVMSLKPDGYLLKTMKPEQIIKTIDEFFEKKKTL